MALTRSRFSPWVAGALLAAFGLIIALARLHVYDEPLERDITTYAVVAHEMLDGRPLYADLWDHKPPAVHLSYLVAELLAGYGAAAIFLLGITTALITLFGVYTAGRLYDGRRGTGLWAAAFWTLIASDMGLQANQPNVEVFLNACLVWAFVFLLKLIDDPVRTRHAGVAGLLLAAASTYKLIAVFIALPLALVVIGDGLRDRRRYLAVTVRHVVILAVVGAAVWMLIAGYFHLVGGFGAFYDAVITYNRSYSGGIGENLGEGIGLGRLLPDFLRFAWPLFVLLIVGALIGVVKGRVMYWWLLAAYVVGIVIAIAAPGLFYPHYYQLWLPVLAIGAAWALSLIADSVVAASGSVARVTGALIAGLLALHAASQYRLSPDDWSRAKYGEQFVASRDVGREIARALTADETFYEWGAETGLYFYSRKHPPTGVFYHYPLFPGRPGVQELSTRVIAQLAANPPALVVLFRPHTPPAKDPKQIIIAGHPVLDWIGARYRPLPNVEQPGAFVFLAQQNSRLYNVFAAQQ